MRQRKRGENAILAYSLPIIAIQDRNESGEYPRKQNEIDVGIRQMARTDQIIQNRERAAMVSSARLPLPLIFRMTAAADTPIAAAK